MLSIVFVLITISSLQEVTWGHSRSNHHDEDPEEELDKEIPIYLHEQHLSDKLVGGPDRIYRRMARPVSVYDDTIRIEFGAGLMQIVDLNEKLEILVTKMWLTMDWIDHDLTWVPTQYGNLTSIRLHADDLWAPDIALYNTAESSFKIPLENLATIRHNGSVTWAGPVFFRSSCFIDMSNFPFDRQNCSLKIGPWSWSTSNVDMVIKHHLTGHPHLGLVDMKRYWKSAEWELELAYGIKSSRHYESTADNVYADVTYFLILRRLPLFFAVNVIVPCFEISIITVMTFLLPVGSFEKTILSISVLVALTVFLIRIIDIVPPTSLVIPLLGKYLLSTTVVLTLAIIINIITVAIHYKNVRGCRIPRWIRIVFIEVMPRLLRIKIPTTAGEAWTKRRESNIHSNLMAGKRLKSFPSFKQCSGSSCFGNILARTLTRLRTNGKCKEDIVGGIRFSEYYSGKHGGSKRKTCKLYERNDQVLYREAIEGLMYACEKIQRQEVECRIRAEWRFVSTVLDRLFLIVYVLINIGTGMMMFVATYHKEPELPK